MPTFYDQIPTFRKIGRFFTWRRVRRILLASVSVVTLFAVYFTEEDWRGHRMWDAYIKQLAAQGVPVTEADLDKFKPAPVPDDQNFWKAPIIRQFSAGSPGDMLEKVSDEFSWDKLAGKNSKLSLTHHLSELGGDLESFMNFEQPGMGYDGTGYFVDISAWKKALEQPDLVEAFKVFDPALDEIAVACRRPFVRLHNSIQGPAWRGSFWYQGWDLGEVYELRGLAELDAGQPDRAADDAVTLLGSCDTITGVRAFNPTSGLQVLWEGLAKHRWTDGQLAKMQAALQKVDGFPLLVQSYNRIGPYYYIQNFENSITDSSQLADRIRPYAGPHRFPYWWYRLRVALYPTGRMYQIGLDDLQAYETMLTTFDALNRKIDGTKLNAQRGLFIKNHPEVNEKALDMTITGLLASQQLIYDLQVQQEIRGIRVLDLAVVACGLERYRLANGQFPEKLDDIAPRFLAKIPHDIIGGGPLHYRRLDDGKYLLYAIGDDGIDYGGKPYSSLSYTTNYNNQSDLVWPGLPKSK